MAQTVAHHRGGEWREGASLRQGGGSSNSAGESRARELGKWERVGGGVQGACQTTPLRQRTERHSSNVQASAPALRIAAGWHAALAAATAS